MIHWYKLMVNGITFMTLRHHTFDGWIIKFHGQIMLNPPFSNEIRRCWRFNPHWLDVSIPICFDKKHVVPGVARGVVRKSSQKSKPNCGHSATLTRWLSSPFTATGDFGFIWRLVKTDHYHIWVNRHPLIDIHFSKKTGKGSQDHPFMQWMNV